MCHSHGCLKSFVSEIFKVSFSLRTVIIQIESTLSIYLCIHWTSIHPYVRQLGKCVDIRVIAAVASLILIFMIVELFRRREQALQYLASLKSNLTTIYYLSNTDTDNIHDLYRNILICTYLYLSDTTAPIPGKVFSEHQSKCKNKCYQFIHKLFEMVNKTSATPLHTTLIRECTGIINNFESLCSMKDYSIPFGTRVLSILLIHLLPIILAPYFIQSINNRNFDDKYIDITEHSIHDMFAIYLWSSLFFWIFGCLLQIKENLVDPFNGDSINDDIMIDWQDIMKDMEIRPYEQESSK